MYRQYNPNPNGIFVGDCVIRAISKLLDTPWKKVYVDLALQGYVMGDMPSSNAVWGAYLRRQGFSRETLPNTCPDCYTVEQFCREHPEGDYLLCTGSHVVAIQNGDYYDSWDSGQEIPIYFFRRR